MPESHTLLELRVGKSNQMTPEAAVQLFATLPDLQLEWFPWLRTPSERLSFEIVCENQLIFFVCYCPTRLVEYCKGIIAASYPDILITPLKLDPIASFIHPSPHHLDQQSTFVSLGTLKLTTYDQLSLKTYHDFTAADPLTPLISTLSQLEVYDRVVIQHLVSHESQSWKDSVQLDVLPAQSQPLASKKLAVVSLQTSIRIAVSAQTAARSSQVMEAVSSAYQTFTMSGGNSLQLSDVTLRPQAFLNSMYERKFSWKSDHLSLEELATLFHLPTHQLSSFPNIAWGKRLLGEPPENLPTLTSTTSDELKKDINAIGKVRFKNQETTYGLQRADRRRHLYVIGKTGTGKSTLLANMAINDLKNNEGICVIDPHGDLIDTLLDYIPSNRINDVIYFDPSDTERTVKLNLFEGNNVVHRELIASGIVSIFRKLYAYSWGPRLEYILRNALLTLLKSENSRLSDISRLLTDPQFRQETVEKLDDDILRNFWTHEFEPMQDKQKNESIAPILNKVGQFVSSPLIRDVVNARKSSFSIEEAMEEGKIVLVNLSQGKLGEDNATLLGAMLITKIQLAAMARVNQPENQRRDFYLYVDEFQNFATESFSKILSEARKYRLNLTLANQYISQIPEDVQKAIFGNCGSMVSFVMGADDAGVFSKEYGERYSSEDLVSLGRYQIINRLAIGNVISEPFPAQTLTLARSSNQNRDKVVRVSRERYAEKK